ncbi:hypothetical protein AMTR_s00192p00040250 [Amborella trichopoda]|uniref:Uncharacterized protein n=1 Tax=Amborella trichopoda TaxID=13333 RepID=U5D7Q2_AMBTC|nr:hypothetical protein AMTR_s00192p00040250 [Amborella trichopoda]
MTPWMEEWRDRIAQVIGVEEHECISLSLYEEKYRVVLRDVATLTDHGERRMQQFRIAYLGGNQFFDEEVTSLSAKRDLALEERDLILEDLESLRRDFEGRGTWQNKTQPEIDSLIDKSGKLSGLLLAAGGNPSLTDLNPYVRVPLPSSVQSPSQSQASTRMTRSPRRIGQRLEGEASTRTPVPEKDSGSRM